MRSRSVLAAAFGLASLMGGVGCAFIAPFPDLAPDPEAGCEGAGCAESRVLESLAFGSEGEQRGSAVAVSEGGPVLAGYASGKVDFGGGELGEIGSASKRDGLLAAFTPEGALRWGKRFSDCMPRGVAVDLGGEVLLAGGADGPVNFGGGQLNGDEESSGGEDVVLARFDAEGKHIWSRRFGDGQNQYANAAAVDAAGNSFAVGTFWGKLNFGGASNDAGMKGPVKFDSAGGMDGFIVKLDEKGKPLWGLQFGDEDHQEATAIAVDDQGNALVAGWFKGALELGGRHDVAQGEADLFVAKLSPAGDVLWVRVVPSTHAGRATGLAVDGTGNVLVSGSFSTSLEVGETTLTTAGDKDAVLIKLDEYGAPRWARAFGDDADQEALGVAVDPEGHALVTGAFLGSVALDAGELAATGAADGFLAKLSPGGGVLWARSFGDPSEQGGAAVAVDPGGNAWATGYFGGAVDFGSGPLQSGGASDIFLVAIGP